jgi:small subunit ribosomal protein S8
MATTDPISDMLTSLRNALAVHKDTITIPHSKVREAIAKLLQQEGYLGEIKVMTEDKFPVLQIGLKYAPNGRSVIQGIRRVSKPGQRIYSATNHLHTVLGGVGISVVSTSSGLMTNYHAKQKGFGGEVLFKIW